MLSFAGSLPPIPACVDLKQRAFDARYGSYLDDIATGEYADRKLPRACLSSFRAVVFASMTHQMPSSFSTGIVIAGYGHEQMFPQLYELTFDGGFLDTIRHYDVHSIDIASEKQGAAISTFAQDDTVQEFLKGINQRFEIFHTALFTHVTELVAREIINTHAQLTATERRVAMAMIQRRMSEAMETFQEETNEFAEDEFRSRVLQVLRSAPKESLAELAESLVSITSLRQRVSGDLETVGGPVDVAMISKGDGFIWIKRKHYFSKELNPHYTRNYFRELGHGQAEG